jgi:hypothetical protein
VGQARFDSGLIGQSGRAGAHPGCDGRGNVARPPHRKNGTFVALDKFPENIVQLARTASKKLSVAQYLRKINEKKVLARKFTAYNSSRLSSTLPQESP